MSTSKLLYTGDFGKKIVAKCLQKSPKLQQIAISGHTVNSRLNSRVEFTVLENSVTRKVEQKVAKFYQKVAKKVAKLENRFTQVLNQF